MINDSTFQTAPNTINYCFASRKHYPLAILELLYNLYCKVLSVPQFTSSKTSIFDTSGTGQFCAGTVYHVQII